ncbi:MAG: M55 family metallopeptidase, partial [Bacilli bacterium]
MKVFISADIEGVNHITHWNETEYGHARYEEFRIQMTEEVNRACIGAHKAGATEIIVKDAHDSAMNLIFSDLPDYVVLHRGWEGNICSMMAGLDSSFDAACFIGYHSPSRSDGNPLSHTMNTQIFHVKINGVIASEFDINSLYASYLNVPIAFLSGDLNLTKLVKGTNSHIDTVATKEGVHGAVIS